MPEFLKLHLHVRLHNAVEASAPHSGGVVAAGHVGNIEIVVAVVHEIGIVGGSVEVLQLARLVGKHHIEHIALLGLYHRGRSRLGAQRLLLFAWSRNDGAVVGCSFGL